MNIERTIFSQLMGYISDYAFETIVDKYKGNVRVRHFTCWEQYLCMAFAQLTNRESLRDIETCLRAVGTKLYHTGIRSRVSRSTLADANEHRPWLIYHDLAQHLIREARTMYGNEKIFSDITTAIYAFDSTTIDLCLTLFPWARAAVYKKRNAGIKLHTLFEVQQKIPSFVRVSAAMVHDVNLMDALVYEPGAFYIFDRGYIDFLRLKRIDTEKAFFVIRAKRSLRFTRVESLHVNKALGVRADQTIKLKVFYSRRDYPDRLRRIKYYDIVHDQSYVYLTNNFLLDPLTIAQLYRARWEIELFFKWIKQHLCIKAFFGTSPNAVKTQIWIAISIYVLVAMVRKKLHIDESLYTILQILSISLFEKVPILQQLTEHQLHNSTMRSDNQLNLFNL
jgi:Domain of unknown function (DUF4372)/Transposase DDE domain